MATAAEIAKKCRHSLVLRAKDSKIFADDVLLCTNPRPHYARPLGEYLLCAGMACNQNPSGKYHSYVDPKFFFACPSNTRGH